MANLYTGIATIDKLLQIARADKKFYEYVGFDNYASLAGLVHPDDLEHFKEAVSGLGEKESTMTVMRLKVPDETYHYVLAELSDIVLEDAKDKYVELRIQDISDLEKNLGEIYDENHFYGEYLDLWGSYLFLYETVTDSFRVFSGGRLNRVYSFRGTIKQFEESLIEKGYVAQEDQTTFQALCADIANGTKNFEYTLLLRDKSVMDAKTLTHFIKGRTILNSRREFVVLGAITCRSINGAAALEQTQKEHERDVTTGLLTKKAIIEYTENLLRNKPKYNVNLCVVDVDNFKQVNDTLGHLFGDEVLARVADILKEAVAGKGLVGRIGGDEMFIVLEGVNTLSDLRGILRSIRSNVEWAYKDRKEVPSVTCSIGVSTYPDDAVTYDDLFKIADKMLYRAKQKGKNRYIVYAYDVHGDVLSEGESPNLQSSVAKQQDKEELVLKMLGYLARQSRQPYEVMLQDIGNTFALDEVHLFYGDEGKKILESYWNANDGSGSMPAESFADCVHEENFAHLYREHNMAVIDKPDLIEQLCPRTHQYLMSHGIKVALIYKMDYKKHEGYIAYCKMSDTSRKWSDSDMANLTYISKTIELLINDK